MAKQRTAGCGQLGTDRALSRWPPQLSTPPVPFAGRARSPPREMRRLLPYRLTCCHGVFTFSLCFASAPSRRQQTNGDTACLKWESDLFSEWLAPHHCPISGVPLILRRSWSWGAPTLLCVFLLFERLESKWTTSYFFLSKTGTKLQ